MGFDRDRFEEEICERFLCGICLDVVQKPKMIKNCEHIFCECCVEDITRNNIVTCPMDRVEIGKDSDSIREPFRFFREFYDVLRIRCVRYPECEETVDLKDLETHERECIERSKIYCTEGCGVELDPAELSDHRCVYYLWQRIEDLENQCEYLRKELQKYVDQ